MRTLNKLLSVLLALVLLCGLAVLPVRADEGEASPLFDPAEATEETFSIGVSENVLEPGEEYLEPGAIVEPEDGLSVMSDGDEPLAGEPVPVADPADAGGDDGTLGFDEEFDESLDNEDMEVLDEFEIGDGDENGDEDHLGGIGGADVRFAQSSLVLTKGQSVTLNVSYANAPKNGKLYVAVWKNALQQSNAVSCRWGAVSKGVAKLTVTAQQTGTCYIMVYLCNSLSVPYATAKLPTNVCSPYLSPMSAISGFKVEEGATKTASFIFGGYTGVGLLRVYSTNESAFRCTIADAKGDRFNVRVTGRAAGSGKVIVEYVASQTGQLLARYEFLVTVTPKVQPRLILSDQGMSLTKNSSKSISVSYSGYSGYAKLRFGQNSSAVSCKWGSWNGSSIPLTVTGVNNGSCTVTVWLLTSTDVVLATAQLSVTVAPQPLISGGVSAMSFESGRSQSADFSITNITKQNTISCTVSNSSVCTASVSGSGSSYRLTVAGRNAGSATVTIKVKDGYGNVVASKNVSVTVKPAQPRVSVSPGSLSVHVGQKSTLTVSVYNTSGSVKLSWSRSGGNSTASWGSWYGNTVPLSVSGTDVGTDTYTIRLIRCSDNAVLASTTVKVTVQPKKEEKLLDINSLSYAFNNYSTVISLKNYQRLYGTNQKAASLHSAHEKSAHGVCFGMATSAVLFYGGKLSAWDFGASKISSLTAGAKQKYSSSLGMYLSDVIEMMYTSQFAVALNITTGIDKTARAVISELDAGRPVCLTFYGDRAHEVMAIGYSLSGNTLTLSIYDNNYNRQTQKLVMTRPSAGQAFNAWSYNTPHGYVYSSAKHTLAYSEYATVAYVWNNRGNASVINSRMKGTNFVITAEDDFELYTVDMNTMEKSTTARLVDGELTDAAEGVYSFRTVNDDEGSGPNILIVPADYYFVEDGTPEDGLSITVVDELLSTTIETDRSDTSFGAMGLCAVDDERLADAAITVADGASYRISIGSTAADGSAQIISKEGVGMGGVVTLGLSAEGLNLGDSGDGAAVSVEPFRVTYGISAVAGEGGAVSPAGETLLSEGENLLYTFTPEPGYSVDRVLIDGEDVGPVYSWYFEDVSEHHSVTAVFKRNLSDFEIQVSKEYLGYTGEELRPAVTVTDPNGDALIENVDYVLAYNNNVELGEAEVVALALPDSPYYGSLSKTYYIVDRPDEGEIASAELADGVLSVTLTDKAYETPKQLLVTVYDAQGQMADVRVLRPQTPGETLSVRTAALKLPKGARYVLYLVKDDGLSPCADPWQVE